MRDRASRTRRCITALRLSDGTVLDVNFDVPVNGWKTSILPPQGGEDRFPLKFEKSMKDYETVIF